MQLTEGMKREYGAEEAKETEERLPQQTERKNENSETEKDAGSFWSPVVLLCYYFKRLICVAPELCVKILGR